MRASAMTASEPHCPTAERLFASPWPALKIKAGRMWQAIDLFYREGLSTTAIATRLDIDEQHVCDLLEEAALR